MLIAFNTISFTVNGTTYTALEGMTYYDWAISSYAPTEYNEYYSSITVDGVHLFREPTSGYYYEDNSEYVAIYSLSTIVNGADFSLTSRPSYPE